MFWMMQKWQWNPRIDGTFQFALMYGMQQKQWDPGMNFGDTIIIRVAQHQHGGTSIEFNSNLEFQSLSSSDIDLKLLEDKQFWEGRIVMSPFYIVPWSNLTHSTP